MPVLVATITPKEGQSEAVEAALTSIIPAVHEEDGCEKYALHRSKGKLIFIEKWRDTDALGAHGSGPNIKALNDKLKGLVEGRPDVQVLEPVAAGDPAKGQL